MQSLGDVALQQRRCVDAEECYKQALHTYRQIGDRLGEANCVRHLGDAACMQAHYAEAEKLYQQALPICRQTGDRLGEANCLRSMARLAELQHNGNLAHEASELAADIYSTIGLTAQAQLVRDEFTQSQP